MVTHSMSTGRHFRLWGQSGSVLKLQSPPRDSCSSASYPRQLRILIFQFWCFIFSSSSISCTQHMFFELLLCAVLVLWMQQSGSAPVLALKLHFLSASNLYRLNNLGLHPSSFNPGHQGGAAQTVLWLTENGSDWMKPEDWHHSSDTHYIQLNDAGG